MNRTKSRLMDSQEQDQRSGAVLKDSEVEEEDPFSDEDLPEEYKKVKFSTLTVLQLKVDKMTGAKVLPYVSSIWICLLVGAYIWLLKTRVVKVLAMSFHVSTFFDRIQESLFNQYVIEMLSGPPLVGIDQREHEEEEKVMSEVLADLKARTPRKTPTASTPRSVLSTLDEKLPQPNYEDESAVQITSEKKAKAAAKKIFNNVAKPGSNVLRESWLIDSGCTNLMTCDKDLFKDLRPTKVTKVRIGHGGYIPAKGMGTITIETQSGTKIISDVLYVPDLNQNLLSVGQLLEKGFKLYFKDKHCLIKEASRQDIFKVKMRGRSFSLNPLEEERGFHQLCVEPPLLKEDIPPDDKGWLCPGCDCKVDCIDLLNDLQGTDLSATDSREKYIPSSDKSNFYSTSKDLTEAPPKDDGILGLSSEDSKDDDFNPDHPDKDESVKIESSSSDFTSDSKDFSLIVDTDRLGGDKQGVFSLLDNITPTSSSQEEKAKVGKGKRNKNEFSYLMQCLIPLVLAKRHVERLDYKKLNDETYGNESSDSSEKEYEGGPSP
ncbi:putative serine/threonine-protein kinase roco7-like [Capsicum annuum]|nr:putative serine/threonine-protein kinase roco7-like [Capsicum annuum]